MGTKSKTPPTGGFGPVAACGRVWRCRAHLKGGLTTTRLKALYLVQGEGAAMRAMFDAALLPKDRKRAAQLRWSESKELFSALCAAYIESPQ